MDYRDILARRRSIRRFTDEAVTEETLRALIDDAVRAPSSGNEQPWRFVVVRDADLMSRIAEDAKASLLAVLEEHPDHPAKKYETMLNREGFNVFHNAPAVIFVIGDKSLKNTVVNCTLAAGTLMMSAVDRGLGTCWINFAAWVSSPELLDRLGIAERDVIVAPLIVGYPETVPEMSARSHPRIDVIG